MSLAKIRRLKLDKIQPKRVMVADKLAIPIRSIGIIAYLHDETQIAEIETFVNAKRKQGKEVDYIMHTDLKNIIHDQLIDAKNKKWTGELKCSASQAFLEKNYDIIYLPTKTLSFEIEYLLRKSSAIKRVGIYHPDTQSFLDFSIDSTQTNLNKLMIEIDEVRQKLKK